MKWRKWNELPKGMQYSEIKEYYDILNKKRFSLRWKRVFDIIVAIGVFLVTAIPMLIIAIMIKLDSEGPVFFRQERVTAYGKKFKIHKFRTMNNNADKIGSAITVNADSRITNIGKKLRKYHLDELPQVFDILNGNMSFVGTRPELVKYVKAYTKEMRATLLLPAGVTSAASIQYKNEAEMISKMEIADKVYIEEILPQKMEFNLRSIRNYSFLGEIKIMIRTIFTVLEERSK